MSSKEGETMYKTKEKEPSKKRGRPPKKIKEDHTPKEHIILQKPTTRKGELEGETRKKWVKFMKEVKQWANDQNMTNSDLKGFAAYYYKAIANSSNQEKNAESVHKKFQTLVPFRKPNYSRHSNRYSRSRC